jgi:hypothetical protein
MQINRIDDIISKVEKRRTIKEFREETIKLSKENKEKQCDINLALSLTDLEVQCRLDHIYLQETELLFWKYSNIHYIYKINGSRSIYSSYKSVIILNDINKINDVVKDLKEFFTKLEDIDFKVEVESDIIMISLEVKLNCSSSHYLRSKKRKLI